MQHQENMLMMLGRMPESTVLMQCIAFMLFDVSLKGVQQVHRAQQSAPPAGTLARQTPPSAGQQPPSFMVASSQVVLNISCQQGVKWAGRC